MGLAYNIKLLFYQNKKSCKNVDLWQLISSTISLYLMVILRFGYQIRY